MIELLVVAADAAWKPSRFIYFFFFCRIHNTAMRTARQVNWWDGGAGKKRHEEEEVEEAQGEIFTEENKTKQK